MEIEKKGEKAEVKYLKDSKWYNKKKMKYILAEKFHNHSLEVDLHSVQKSVRNRKSSLKVV